MNIYPNPAEDIINIEGNGITNVMIYNLSGIKVLETDQGTIDASELAAGVYFARVQSGNQVITQKIISAKQTKVAKHGTDEHGEQKSLNFKSFIQMS